MPGNDSFTKVLHHFDGFNGSTVISDSAAGGSRPVWANNTGSISTVQSKFGGSAYDATTSGWVDTPNNSDFVLGSGSWTIDTWFYRSGGDGARRLICGQSDSGGSTASVTAWMELDSTNVLRGVVSDGVSLTVVMGTTVITTVGWHHAALVRIGNILRLFLDGVQEGGDVAFAATVNTSTNKYAVGRIGELASLQWNGYLDEFRLSVGTARWTSNFVPPNAAYSQDPFSFGFSASEY